MYRLAPSELQEVTHLLAKKLTEPSTSPFGAPILFVKTGDLRMVVDYRALDKDYSEELPPSASD